MKLKESKIEKQTKKHPNEVLKYNASRLIRIYPDNLRFDSSNYDPVTCWNFGCQVVALNYQTPDLPMQLNRGRFRDNGNCGYVLRPPFLNPPAPKAKKKKTARSRLGSLGARRRGNKDKTAGGDGAADDEASQTTRLHTLADDDDDGFASDYDMDKSDDEETSSSEEESDEDGSEKCRWYPPTDINEYIETSPFATEAMNLTIRIISAENIPGSSMNGGMGQKKLRRQGSPAGLFSMDSYGSSGGGGGGGSGDGACTVEVELHGAPCDQRQFVMKTPPRPSEGTKFIFDQALATPVAEPRLALLRVTILRQNAPVAQAVLPVDKLRPG